MRVNGIVPNQTVVLVDVEQNGPSSVSVVYRRADGGHGRKGALPSGRSDSLHTTGSKAYGHLTETGDC